MNPRRWLLAAVAAVAVLLVTGRVTADLYAEYAWYRAMGATSVWFAAEGTIALWRLVAWFAATLVAAGNLLTVRRSVLSLVLQRQVGNLQIGETVPSRVLTGSVIALSVVVGGALALAHDDWQTILLARAGRSFHELDPSFSRDFSFFVYWLPFESAMWRWCALVLATVSAVVVLLYILTDGIRVEAGRVVASAHVRRHLMAIAGLGLLLLAWHFRLAMYRLALNPAPIEAVTAALTDESVGRQSGLLVLALGTIGAGLIVLWTGISGQLRLGVYAIVGIMGFWVVVAQLLPQLTADLTQADDMAGLQQQARETEAAYTRRAFDADRIGTADSTFRFASLGEAAPSVSLWEGPALRRAVAPARVPDSSSSWVAWRASADGIVAHVLVRGEERAAQRISWLVATLDGADADGGGSPVDAAIGGNGPDRRASGSTRSVTPPRVFPGATGYEVVLDSLHRLAGVSLASTMSRVAHAWSYQDPSLLADVDPSTRPALVSHVDLRERIRRVVPFFEQGSVVTPIVAGDSVYWVVDLYSASTWYPRSRRVTVGLSRWSYFHHAAVAIVDGGTGQLTVIADASLDPVAASWVERFRALFSSWNVLPGAVQSALPPPFDAARVTAAVLARFGREGDGDSPRHVPVGDGSDSVATATEPLFALPGGGPTALAIPVLDAAEYVAGALIASGGRDQRMVWVAPGSGRAPARWPALLERLRSLDSVNAQGEAALVRGRVRTIPLRDRLLYAQPVFRWTGQGSPGLSYVVASDTDSAWRGATLRELSGGDSGGLTRTPPGGGGSIALRAAALYEAMRAAQRRGDWAAFGAAFDALGRLLGRPPGDGRR